MKSITDGQIAQFRQDLRHFTRWMDKINKASCRHEINVAQCHIMMELGTQSQMTVNDLAHQMKLDKSTISRQVESIVSADMAVRVPDKEDRRKVEVSLSKNGSKLYKQINKEMDQNFACAFVGISSDDIDTFLTVFSKLSNQEIETNE